MRRHFWKFFGDGVEGLRKDLAKAAIWLALLGFVYVTFRTLGDGIPPDAFDKTGSFSWSLFGKWISERFVVLIGSYPDWWSRRPLTAAGYHIGVAAAAILAVLVARYWRLPWLFIAESLRRKDLQSKMGVFGYWPNADPEEMRAPWSEMSQRILDPPMTILHILGATGWETFGAKGSPLHDAVCGFKGSMRIMLMNPDSSRYLSQRAASLSVSSNRYKQDIRKTIRMLGRLKRQGSLIELHLYDSPPNWKMIFTPRTLWLQHYDRGEHVADTSVYLLYATDSRKGLYHAMLSDFERIWDLSAPKEFN